MPGANGCAVATTLAPLAFVRRYSSTSAPAGNIWQVLGCLAFWSTELPNCQLHSSAATSGSVCPVFGR